MKIVDKNIRDIIKNVDPAKWILCDFSDDKKCCFIRCILLKFNAVFTK